MSRECRPASHYLRHSDETKNIILGLERRVSHNDVNAFNQLIGLYVLDIFRYLELRSNEEDANDLTQEVMAKAIKSYRGKFKYQGYGLKVLLYRMAHNALIDHYRTSHPTVPLEDIEGVLPSNSDDSPFEYAARGLDKQKLKAAMSRLTVDQQTILQLRFFEEYKINEIAELMHKKPAATWGLLYRALEAIRNINPNLLDQLNLPD